jgi:hypothetical protein
MASNPQREARRGLGFFLIVKESQQKVTLKPATWRAGLESDSVDMKQFLPPLVLPLLFISQCIPNNFLPLISYLVLDCPVTGYKVKW